MRALVLEEIGRLVVQQLPKPEADRGEILLQIVATGICGSDIHGYSGESGRRSPGQVMGHESEAIVAALGPETKHSGLRVGERVTFNPVVVPDEDVQDFAGREQHSANKYVVGVAKDIVSSLAEFMTIPARNVVPLSDDLPRNYGALVEPLAVALHAVRRAAVPSGSRVIVLGGGPIGQSLVLALRMEGIDAPLVSEISAERRNLLERLGAQTVDPKATDVVTAVEATWGRPADIAFDAVGISITLNDALAATVIGGKVCLVGMGAKRVDVDAFAISVAERTIVGSFTYSAADFVDAANWISNAPEGFGELISREVSLEDGDAAFQELSTGNAVPGKIIIRMDV
jgi:threonine dehydrogenase-like Zn-dependent dehydrogenase